MRIIPIAGCVALAITPVAALAETPLQKETSVWQAYKDKKADKFKGFIAPDYVGVYEDGTYGRDRELEGLKTSTLSSFKISNFNHRLIDPENVLMTYVVELKGKDGKRDISGVYRASSVWHRSGTGSAKTWRAVYHSQIKTK